MTFSENLKQIRKERGITQEELAEMLEVSRQAVSKWELNDGYPEVEKLILLSSKLNVSLDYLLDNCNESKLENNDKTEVLGRILISSFDKKSIVNCCKINSSYVFATKANDPKYALFGIDGTSLFGDNSTILGWYADKESIQKEMVEIMQAMKQGQLSYDLKYAADVKVRWGIVKIKEKTKI